jgi:hypothetical protein
VVRHLLSRFLLVRCSICSRGQVLIGSSTVPAAGSGSVGESAQSLSVRIAVRYKACRFG